MSEKVIDNDLSEWKEVKLEELLKFGNGKKRPESNGLIPIYGGNGILGYCGENNYDNETIIIGRVGAYCGSVYFEDKPIWISDNALSAKPKKDYDAKFLYYFLKEINLNQHAGGSSHPLITQTLLNSLEFKICTCPVEQKAIAEVLSSLDDKIDLLHRQNKTLEQMVETLFRQWFVHRPEPVEGEEAKEDWEETTLGEIIKIGSGKGLKKEKFVDYGKYPILGANGEIGRINEYLFDDRLIFTGRVGTLGNVFRIENKKVWLSDNTLVIKPTKYYNFVYFIMKNAKLEQYNVGSTQPLIRQSDIKEIKIQLTKKDIHLKFENDTDLFFVKIQKNNNQICTLEKLRDTLLPKLMSGEVRMNHVEENGHASLNER